ncbi:hypothetical protein FY145_18915 [Agrobacterium tumefaciens]|uniref:Uncharacterized protein n=1 Tax=Agrobacterium tumefaciens TaxID=358 RepID=A0AAP9J804_AGRTU|nr:hypothetical protein [Agrobacterium tumefaciens]NSZ59878.1 hypothetical protein [Agrobacterium tumefaciens]QDY96307.1 hypothetical protein CG010_019255 [Agrobacterium tumefaciens]UXS46554.1 hypothetical protein FY149_04620 [Agrobacterium tumefaciens]UXS72863.1 hypothetical protein FY146_20305 [Agrobacterium tumefaciens]UXS80302.1 hypothetical protein FY145_18915 [Agrobacterium tumefaciens]
MTDDDFEPVSAPKDRPLNPYRLPNSVRLASLVRDIAAEVDASLPERKRKRRAIDQNTFDRTVAAVICDLALYSLMESGDGISVRRSNIWPPARYRTPVQSKLLAPILDALSESGLDYVHQNKGQQGFEAHQSWLTSLRPTQKLKSRLEALGIDFDDIGQEDAGEVIHLASPKTSRGGVELAPYEDTAETIKLREQMATINSWLVRADISLDEFMFEDGDHYPDITQRKLVRRFTRGSFDSGGRLWNGFWQVLKKKRRRDALSIDGEEVVELDYGQAGARILYGLARLPVPKGDLYNIPGFEDYRSGVKQGFAAMVAADRRLTRTPGEIKANLGRKHTMAKFTAAVEAYHGPVAHLFFNGVGHTVQRIESDILVNTLLGLIDRGITALPIHDAVVVPRSAAMIGRDIMMEAFLSRSGVDGAVSSYPPDALGAG